MWRNDDNDGNRGDHDHCWRCAGGSAADYETVAGYGDIDGGNDGSDGYDWRVWDHGSDGYARDISE